MRTRVLIAVLLFTLSSLIICGTQQAQAGSFFGPCCYGAEYTYRYPNRSHNVFGCGPCTHCQAWHPFFKHHLLHRNSNGMNGATMANMPPGTANPLNLNHGNVVPGTVLPNGGISTSIAPVPTPASPLPGNP